jgi:hypothetical protein
MPRESRLEARAKLAILGLVALAGLTLGWNKGQLPERESSAQATTSSNDNISPDLALYSEVIMEVRAGRNYYEVAREKIPTYGFPLGSPLNWRLPTYAWTLSCLRCGGQIQLLLIGLSILALGLTFAAHCRTSSVGIAALATFLLFGVLRWAIDGYAYLAQEPWAATLMLISLAAGSLGSGSQPKSIGWRCLSVAAGIAALLFRELALPYCAAACVLAAWNRRWLEAAAWAAGIALFFAFFAWHVGQVRAQLAGTEVATSAGLAQWLRFGGLDFVLLTTRLNSLIFAAPAWLLWLYLLLALVGLGRGKDETSRVACLASLGYLLAYAAIGRPENFYWGLLPAPLLAWGLAQGPQGLFDMFSAAGLLHSREPVVVSRSAEPAK